MKPQPYLSLLSLETIRLGGGSLLAVILLALPLFAAAAQAPSDSLIAEGDALHFNSRPEQALAHFQALLEGGDPDPEVLWRACRESIVIGMNQDVWEREKRWYEEAEEYGRRAVALDPLNKTARYYLLAATGRRSLHLPPQETIDAAQDIYEGVNELLALDPDHPGGHMILGKFHAEVMHLSAFKRFLARLFGAGEGLRTASWEKAETHLRRAIELDPDAIVHHLELGRMYMWTDRPVEARTSLLKSRRLPVLGPEDVIFKREAGELLRELEEGGGNAGVPPFDGVTQ